MSDAALFEDDGLEADELLFDDLDEMNEMGDGLDFDASDGLDFDGADAFDALDDDSFEDDSFDLAEDGLDDEMDLFEDDDGFAFDEAAGLYTAMDTPLVSGPAAVAMMRSLQPLVFDSLDADDADAFFGRLFRGIRNVAGKIGRGISSVASRVGKFAVPLLTKAMPFVQKMVRMIPGWGNIASAALGGIQGLMSGKGLGGALRGALGGLLPPGLGGLGKTLGGVLGGKGGLGGALGGLLGGRGGGGLGGLLGGNLSKLLSGVLGGDGADDDADLDALADYADVAKAPHSIVHPVAAGLGARLVFRRLLGEMSGLPMAQILKRLRSMYPAIRNVQHTFLNTARRVAGHAGSGVRAVRHAARRAMAVAAPHTRSVRSLVRTAPAAAKTAARQVLGAASRTPRVYARPVAVSARRHRARRQILRRIPMDLLFRGYAMMPA